MLFYSFSFMVICCYSSDRKLIQPQPLQGSPRPACPHATLEGASPLPHCSEPPLPLWPSAMLSLLPDITVLDQRLPATPPTQSPHPSVPSSVEPSKSSGFSALKK